MRKTKPTKTPALKQTKVQLRLRPEQKEVIAKAARLARRP